MLDPNSTMHFAEALILGMVAGLLGGRVTTALRSGHVRFWNAIILRRATAPRRFWVWTSFLALVAVAAALVLVAWIASFTLSNLVVSARRALDVAGIATLVVVVASLPFWRVARSRP